jgi:hypothetical protein
MAMCDLGRCYGLRVLGKLLTRAVAQRRGEVTACQAAATAARWNGGSEVGQREKEGRALK